MLRAELGFDGSRFGYILNPSKPNKYPPYTQSYLVHTSLIGQPAVPWVPATPTSCPRLPRCLSGGKRVKKLGVIRGTGTDKVLGLTDPAPLARGLISVDSGARPPLHRGCTLGGKFTHSRERDRLRWWERWGTEGRVSQPHGTPPSGPRQVEWPGPATSGGGFGPTPQTSSATRKE